MPFYGERNGNKGWCESPDMLQRTWSMDIYENMIGEITRHLLIVMQNRRCKTSNMKTFTRLAAIGDNYYFMFSRPFQFVSFLLQLFRCAYERDRQTQSRLPKYLTAWTTFNSASQTTASQTQFTAPSTPSLKRQRSETEFGLTPVRKRHKSVKSNKVVLDDLWWVDRPWLVTCNIVQTDKEGETNHAVICALSATMAASFEVNLLCVTGRILWWNHIKNYLKSSTGKNKLMKYLI